MIMRVGVVYMVERMKGKKGFTLIEIIVVIVILAVLMAVTVPSVMQYTVASKDAKYEVGARAVFQRVQYEYMKFYIEKGRDPTGKGRNSELVIPRSKFKGVNVNHIRIHVTADHNVDALSATIYPDGVDTVSLHKVDTNLVTFTVYDRIQFIDCVRDDGTKLDQGTYVSDNRYRVGDYVTYNNKIYLKVAKTGDWVVTGKNISSGIKIEEKQVNDTLSPGNALSGWQLMNPAFDPNSTYLKGDLVVNQNFGSADIYCCDLKYGNLTVDALGYSGSSTLEDARKYSWTNVGDYSNAKNSTKQQYKDWLTKYLTNSEIYG